MELSRTSAGIRATLSGETSVSGLRLSCQQEMSRFRDDKHKPDQEKVASSEKDAERKKCQRETVLRADAVSHRDN